MAEGSSLKTSVAAQIGVALGLLAIIGIAYYVVFYSDVSSRIDAAKVNQRKIRANIAVAEKATRAYNDDRADLEDRRQRQRELSKTLPKTTEYPAFLSSLQAVANVSGVKLTAWTPKRERPEQYYARVPMEIEVEGRYHQIAKFFYGVAQLDRIINIEDISISDLKGKKGKEEILEVTALATAFHSLDQKTRSAGGKGKKKKRKGGK
jgi:type IV pilus assembly protein PilO